MKKLGARATQDFQRVFLGCLETRGYTQRLMPEKEWKTLKERPFAEQKAIFQSLMSAPRPLHPLDPWQGESR